MAHYHTYFEGFTRFDSKNTARCFPPSSIGVAVRSRGAEGREEWKRTKTKRRAELRRLPSVPTEHEQTGPWRIAVRTAPRSFASARLGFERKSESETVSGARDNVEGRRPFPLAFGGLLLAR